MKFKPKPHGLWLINSYRAIPDWCRMLYGAEWICCIYLKVLDRSGWANSVDPDQTAPEEQSDQVRLCLLTVSRNMHKERLFRKKKTTNYHSRHSSHQNVDTMVATEVTGTQSIVNVMNTFVRWFWWSVTNIIINIIIISFIYMHTYRVMAFFIFFTSIHSLYYIPSFTYVASTYIDFRRWFK